MFGIAKSMKRAMPSQAAPAPAGNAGMAMARRASRMARMANGGQVGKATKMAANTPSGTCGPGMVGKRDYKKT